MDSFELRKYYVDLTGDAENAFAVREDGPEGYKYSDNTIRRAIDAFNNQYYEYDRNRAVGLFDKFGPRAGSALANIPSTSPARSFDIVKKEIDEFAHFMREDEPKEQMMALGRGLLQYAQPNPVARVGALLGAFDYLRGNR
jgi:hypothetical protein